MPRRILQLITLALLAPVVFVAFGVTISCIRLADFLTGDDQV